MWSRRKVKKVQTEEATPGKCKKIQAQKYGVIKSTKAEEVTRDKSNVCTCPFLLSAGMDQCCHVAKTWPSWSWINTRTPKHNTRLQIRKTIISIIMIFSDHHHHFHWLYIDHPHHDDHVGGWNVLRVEIRVPAAVCGGVMHQVVLAPPSPSSSPLPSSPSSPLLPPSSSSSSLLSSPLPSSPSSPSLLSSSFSS